MIRNDIIGGEIVQESKILYDCVYAAGKVLSPHIISYFLLKIKCEYLQRKNDKKVTL